MSKGQWPGQFRTFPTDLTYSDSTDLGHANAGKGVPVSLDADGKAKIAANNERIIGTLAEVDSTGALVELGGIQLMVHAGDLVEGNGVNGGASNRVKNATDATARGIVLEILGASAGGEALVYMGGV